jgi:hypothetical protein
VTFVIYLKVGNVQLNCRYYSASSVNQEQTTFSGGYKYDLEQSKTDDITQVSEMCPLDSFFVFFWLCLSDV